MDNNAIKFPAYAKLAQILLGITALFFILYIGQDILIPLAFALLLSILLNPLVALLERIGINRVLAIFLAIFVGVCFTCGILYFIGSQLSMFTQSMPALKEKFSGMFEQIFNWVSHKFHVDRKQIDDWIAKLKSNSLSNAGTMIHSTLTTVSGVLVIIFLLPVYMFMFLFYKPLLLEFFSQLFKGSQQEKLNEVLTETRSLIQNYLIGLLVEAALVAILNSVGLLIIGIDYAILLGVIGALLNVIPYIGGIVGIALPMLIAIATKSPSAALFVFIAYMIVQFIDNNIIVPRIVASRVKINALMSIIVVLVGGALWGVAGMFLSIPVTAIIKVVFDRVPPLAPFGYLIGDTMPEIGGSFFKPKMRRKKKKSPKS